MCRPYAGTTKKEQLSRVRPAKCSSGRRAVSAFRTTVEENAFPTRTALAYTTDRFLARPDNGRTRVSPCKTGRIRRAISRDVRVDRRAAFVRKLCPDHARTGRPFEYRARARERLGRQYDDDGRPESDNGR